MKKTVNYYRAINKKAQIACAMALKKGNLMAISELYTPAEINQAIQKKWIDETFIKKHFDRIELSPSNITISEGGRFIGLPDIQKRKQKNKHTNEQTRNDKTCY